MVCAPRRRKKSCRSLNSAPSNLTPCGVSSSPKLHLITHICFCSEPKNIDLLVFCKYTLSAVSRPRLQVPNTPHRNLKHSLTDGSVEAQWRQPSQLRRLPRAARASRAADRHRRNQQQSRNRIARLKIRPAPILRVSLRPQRSRLPICKFYGLRCSRKTVKLTSTSSSSNDSLYPKPSYKPPSGFKAAKKQLPPSSTTSSLLSDLRGKQLFHITAPSFLPLSKVKEVSLAKILQGEPILEHEGVQYGIPSENIGHGDLGGKSLLLYDSKTQTYYSAPATTMPTYHVQQLIDLPKSLGTEDAVLAAAQDQIKPPRKQPKHLKMRFRPVGSEEGPPETIGSSSEESEGEGKPNSKFPRESKTEREKENGSMPKKWKDPNRLACPGRRPKSKLSIHHNQAKSEMRRNGRRRRRDERRNENCIFMLFISEKSCPKLRIMANGACTDFSFDSQKASSLD